MGVSSAIISANNYAECAVEGDREWEVFGNNGMGAYVNEY